MSTWNDLVPFLAGAATQLVGSIAQYIFVIRSVRGATTREARTSSYKSFRDGDIIQLFGTMSAVIPTAIVTLHDRTALVWCTGIIAATVPTLVTLGLHDFDATDYWGFSKNIFSPACDLAFFLCAAGALAAVLGNLK